MAVRIRLKRMGRKNRAFYRIEVFDAHTKRDGRSIENVGWYDPLVEDNDAKVNLKPERIKHWLGQGAQVSETVKRFLLQKGIIEPSKGRAKKSEKERENRKKRRHGMKKCTSKRKVKKLAAKEKTKNRPKKAPAQPKAEEKKDE